METTARKPGEGAQAASRVSETGAGEPLIFLHSEIPGSTAEGDFAANSGPLSEHFRTIYVDLPIAPVDLARAEQDRSESNAHRVLATMDGLGVTKAHFLGIGIGASTACWIAATTPDRVDKLVLLAPSGCAYSPFTPPPLEGTKAIARFWQDPSDDNLRALVDLLVFDKTHRDGTFANLQHNLDLPGDEDGELGPTDLIAIGHQVLAPALLVWGREDKFSPRDYGLNLLARMKDAQFRLMPNAGHFCQVDQPERFNAMVIDFLESRD